MSKMQKQQQQNEQNCAICNEPFANWHYGAVVCEACKKFFIRSQTDQKRIYACIGEQKCNVTLASRACCQFCRLAKCISVGMSLDKKSYDFELSQWIKTSDCSVCGSESSGVHFGVISCEACKGFYRRSIKSKLYNGYKCTNGEMCPITSNNRNCRYCRFKKCQQVGMSFENCRLGRKSNISKHELVKGHQETQQKRKRSLEETNETLSDHDSSGSSSTTTSTTINCSSYKRMRPNEQHSGYLPHQLATYEPTNQSINQQYMYGMANTRYEQFVSAATSNNYYPSYGHPNVDYHMMCYPNSYYGTKAAPFQGFDYQLNDHNNTHQFPVSNVQNVNTPDITYNHSYNLNLNLNLNAIVDNLDPFIFNEDSINLDILN